MYTITAYSDQVGYPIRLIWDTKEGARLAGFTILEIMEGRQIRILRS